MERSRFAPLLVACLIAAACTPAVEVIHTVPPEVSIMPAKVVAVIGRSGAKPPNDVEDDFLNLFLRTLRSRGAWTCSTSARRRGRPISKPIALRRKRT